MNPGPCTLGKYSTTAIHPSLGVRLSYYSMALLTSLPHSWLPRIYDVNLHPLPPELLTPGWHLSKGGVSIPKACFKLIILKGREHDPTVGSFLVDLDISRTQLPGPAYSTDWTELKLIWRQHICCYDCWRQRSVGQAKSSVANPYRFSKLISFLGQGDIDLSGQLCGVSPHLPSCWGGVSHFCHCPVYSRIAGLLPSRSLSLLPNLAKITDLHHHIQLLM